MIKQMDSTGIILVVGNEESPNAYPSNCYYFRQDSSFRYLFGATRSNLLGTIDIESGETILWGDDITLEDIIWSGTTPSIAELGAEVGVDKSATIAELKSYIERLQKQGRKIHILPPYRGESKISLSRLLSSSIDGLEQYHSFELIVAMAELRECKSQEEIAEIERGYTISYAMHSEAMRLCRAGVVEREIGGRLEGIARAMGAGVSFTPICTQHGETLHNIEREGVLTDGRMMLCDAGAETLEGYCSDHTRSYPINGRFTDIQRDLYNIVLKAHDHIGTIARPDMPYNELQSQTYTTLANGLRDIGLFKSNATIEQIIESKAMQIFMPHGVGHSLGMDVHDCEAYGERSFDLKRYSTDISTITTSICRARWILREGTVLTDEPGLYFIPALIEQHRHNDIIDWEYINRHIDFGGIRIEDDIEITADGARFIGCDQDRQIPITVDEIEQIMEGQR